MDEREPFDGLKGYLSPERAGAVLCLSETGSTNDVLRGLASEGAPAGQIVLADRQTAGRGRVGRSFLSPAGRGIYMSALFRPSEPVEDLPELTAWAAAGLCGAVEKACGVRPGIKWINDLTLGGRKICGVLTELAMKEDGGVDYVIVGAGVNVLGRREDFPPELCEIAGTIESETGKRCDRALLAAEMIRAFDALAVAFPAKRAEYLALYRQSCVTIGQRVRVLSGETVREGEALDVDGRFGLVVRLDGGAVETVTSGEVSVRGLYGYV